MCKISGLGFPVQYNFLYNQDIFFVFYIYTFSSKNLKFALIYQQPAVGAGKWIHLQGTIQIFFLNYLKQL